LGRDKRGSTDDPIAELANGSAAIWTVEEVAPSVVNGSVANVVEHRSAVESAAPRLLSPETRTRRPRELDPATARRAWMHSSTSTCSSSPTIGSMSNVTAELLQLIDPATISSAPTHSLWAPDRETLDLLRQHYATTPIQFTDDTAVIRERSAHAGSVPRQQVPVSLRCLRRVSCRSAG